MKFTIFLFILFLQCTFAQNSAVPSFPISATDPQNFRDYPGGRGENQLIVYTPAYGKKTTGTNQWGVEVTVRENCIIAIGENNSPIHENEFVVSGHGSAKDFLLANAKIGAKVAIANGKVEITFDTESFRIYSVLRERELRKKLSLLKKNLTEENVAIINHLFDSLQSITEIAQQYSSLISNEKIYLLGLQILDELAYRISESPKVEARGVLHRPTERSPEQISAVVKKFADAGFNQIYLETIWRGETIYPGFITRQKRKFQGFDPLRAYLDEAKKYGIQIHAWIHTFSVGYEGTTGDTGRGPILEAHPEWQIVKRNGDRTVKGESGFLFVNPALPEVQEYIASLYKEIRTLYPELSGLEMDDVRYPVNVPLDESSDYSEFSRKEFQKISNVDPININPTDNPIEWEKWRKWREEQVTAFVKKIRWQNPETVLSANVATDNDESVVTKMQNWGEWVQKGYINYVIPQIYSNNTDWIVEGIRKMQLIVGEDFPLFIGLMPNVQASPAILLQHIEEIRRQHVQGIVLFTSLNLTDDQLRLLAIGPFREKALPPIMLRTNTQVKGETR